MNHPSTKAEVILVGDEFALELAGEVPHRGLARRLLAMGLELVQVTAVAGSEWAVEGALRSALERAAVVITFGGLGTRPGDVTARVAARVTGRRLVAHDEIRGVGRAADRPLLLPQRAEPIANPRGRAVGFRVSLAGKQLVCLPAAAAEAGPMLEAAVYPFLEETVAGRTTARLAVLKCFGLPMARVEAALEGFGEWAAQAAGGADGALLVEPFAVFPEIHIKVVASGSGSDRRGAAAAVEARLEAAVAELTRRLGEAVFGRDDETLESVVGRRLRERGETVATAESCTGGLLAGRFTEVPGSSAYFDRGVVTYSNAAKTQLLGVPAELIAAHGAVSTEVAEAMAAGVRRLAGTTYGIAITGIAGPGGGSPEKPVGTVIIALAGPAGVKVRRHRFGGGRREIRTLSVEVALEWLRRTLALAG